MAEKKKINPSQITLGLFIMTLIGISVHQSVSIILAKLIPKIATNSSTLYGLAESFFLLGNIIMTYPMAKWSQKIGRKWMLFIAAVVRMLGIVLLYFAQDLWMVYLARLISGFCAIGAVTGALIHDHFPPDKRGLPIGINAVALLVGYLIGSIFGGILYTAFGDRNSFLIVDALMLIVLLNIIFNIKDIPRDLPEEDKPKKSGLFMVLKTQLLNNRALSGSYILAFINNISFTGLGTYAIYMLFVYYEIPEIQAGLYMIIPITFEAIVFIGVGAKVKKFSKFYKWVFNLCTLCLGGALFLIFYNPFWYYWMVGVVIVTLVAGVMQSTDTINISLIPEDYKSELLGIYRIIAILGGIIGPTLFGLMVDFIWPFFPGIFSLFLIFLSVLIYRKMVKKPVN